MVCVDSKLAISRWNREDRFLLRAFYYVLIPFPALNNILEKITSSSSVWNQRINSVVSHWLTRRRHFESPGCWGALTSGRRATTNHSLNPVHWILCILYINFTRKQFTMLLQSCLNEWSTKRLKEHGRKCSFNKNCQGINFIVFLFFRETRKLYGNLRFEHKLTRKAQDFRKDPTWNFSCSYLQICPYLPEQRSAYSMNQS